MPPTKQNNAPSASMRGLAQPPPTDVALEPQYEILGWATPRAKSVPRSYAILLVAIVATIRAIADFANRLGSRLDSNMARSEQTLAPAIAALPKSQGRAAQARDMRRRAGEAVLADLLEEAGTLPMTLATAALEARAKLKIAIERARTYEPLALRADSTTLMRIAELRIQFEAWGMQRAEAYLTQKLKLAPRPELRFVEVEVEALRPLARKMAEMGSARIVAAMGARAARQGDATKEWESALSIVRAIETLERRSVDTPELRKVDGILTVLDGVLLSLIGPDYRPHGPVRSVNYESDLLGTRDPFALEEVDQRWPARFAGPNAASPAPFTFERTIMAKLDGDEGST